MPILVGEDKVRYDRMIGSFECGYIGLYSEETKQTDIFRINPFEFNKIDYQTSLMGELSSLITHRDYLICDQMVIKDGEIV